MKRVQRGTLGSHAALSVGASVVSALVTLATLPYIVNQLGVAQYGLFALLALASAYVGILDFGFSWTTSRFVAEALGREDDVMLDDVLGTSLVLYVALGVLGGGILVVLAPWLVDEAFNVPPHLRDSGVDAGRLFGLAFPAAMAQTYAGAVLRGGQRFDLHAALQTMSAVGTSAAMVGVVAAGAGVAGVAASVAAVQCVGAVFGLAAVRWVLPTALRFRPPSRRAVSLLGRFTAKVAVTNLGLQFLYLPNRLAVGLLLPLRDVGRFTVPFALAQRLQMIPSALVSAGLPTMTAAFARREENRFRQTFWRLVAANGALLAPPSALVLAWAPTFLTVWFSDAFAGDAAGVLRISLCAVLLNAVTSVLVVACDSVGAPGVPAVATSVAGAANVGLAFALTAAAGIIGAALALTASLLLLVVTIAALWQGRDLPRLGPVPAALDLRRVVTGTLVATVWMAVAWLTEPWIDDRGSLVVWTLLLLAAAYLCVVAVVGRDVVSRLVAPRDARAHT